MTKAKTFRKRKSSLPKICKVNMNAIKKYSPSNDLLNSEKIGAGIMECLINNDPEGAMEIISIYLESLNKLKLIKESKIAKSTLYYSLKHKNPTIKTLAKLLHANAA